MTNKTPILLALLLALPLLNGCSSQEANVYGQDKGAPDEFAVYSRAPLSLPPDFGLRPPKPGAGRPQTLTPRNDARDALLSNAGAAPVEAAQPGGPGDAELTPGIRALLSSAGADNVDPNIRSLVNNETAALSGGNDASFTDSLMFWRQTTGVKGAVIDPAVEQRRMRRKQAEGDVVEETSAPTIQRRGGENVRGKKEKGFWGSLFD